MSLPEDGGRGEEHCKKLINPAKRHLQLPSALLCSRARLFELNYLEHLRGGLIARVSAVFTSSTKSSLIDVLDPKKSDNIVNLLHEASMKRLLMISQTVIHRREAHE
jgi:hypothetical protein